MRLAVFGASGQTGSQLVRLAEGRGWSTRALIRPASRCDPRPGLEILRGTLDSSSDVEATVRGTDAVFCAFGPRSTRSTPFLASATKRIISAMQAMGPRRLLCLTGAMAGELPPNVSFAMRAMAALYRRQCPDLAADASAQERAVIDSGLDWTLVKPPRLTTGRATRRVRADAALPVGLMSRISRSDLAAFMLDEAVAARHIRERVYVCS